MLGTGAFGDYFKKALPWAEFLTEVLKLERKTVYMFRF
jgi:alanyl-tRNA synthetase